MSTDNAGSKAQFAVQLDELDGGVVLVKVSGFLDMHTYERLERTMEGLTESGKYQIIVDLADVEYISSAGVGVFIGCYTTARENDGDVILLSPAEGVGEVFDLLGLKEMFSFEDDLSAARAHFGA